METRDGVEERSEERYSLDIRLIVAVRVEERSMTVVEVGRGDLQGDRWGQDGSTP